MKQEPRVMRKNDSELPSKDAGTIFHEGDVADVITGTSTRSMLKKRILTSNLQDFFLTFRILTL